MYSHSLQCVEVNVTQSTVVISKPIVQKKASSRIGIDDFGELVRSDPSLIRTFKFDVVLGLRYVTDPLATYTTCN